jgi:hypothetical protein
MTPSTARIAGIVTAVAGSALLCAPDRLGPVIGLDSRRDAQLVAALDLVLSPGLIFGKSQWPWLTARAISNVATAAFTLRRAQGSTALRNARVFSALLVVGAAADLRAVRALGAL